MKQDHCDVENERELILYVGALPGTCSVGYNQWDHDVEQNKPSVQQKVWLYKEWPWAPIHTWVYIRTVGSNSSHAVKGGALGSSTLHSKDPQTELCCCLHHTELQHYASALSIDGKLWDPKISSVPWTRRFLLYNCKRNEQVNQSGCRELTVRWDYFFRSKNILHTSPGQHAMSSLKENPNSQALEESW